MEILKFLAKVLDAQIWITAITILLGFAMAVWGPGTPELWEKLIEAAFTVFVGGGFLRDAATALANRN